MKLHEFICKKVAEEIQTAIRCQNGECSAIYTPKGNPTASEFYCLMNTFFVTVVIPDVSRLPFKSLNVTIAGDIDTHGKGVFCNEKGEVRPLTPTAPLVKIYGMNTEVGAIAEDVLERYFYFKKKPI